MAVSDLTSIWRLSSGPKGDLTDVSGIRVGHHTLIDEAAGIRTGVTVIAPPAVFPDEEIPAAAFAYNGTGEMTGFLQVNEWGLLETPIALTGTSGVGATWMGLQMLMIKASPHVGRDFAPSLPVVGECNDSYLNDSRILSLRPEHVIEAAKGAVSEGVAWGAVGAGTGMTAFGFKSGIGSASRLVEIDGIRGTVGVAALVNFGQPGDLIVAGIPVGHLPGETERTKTPAETPPDGSLIGIIATDLPLDHHGLMRLARRGPLGMGRVGGYGRHGSGDLFLALSTAPREVRGPLVGGPVLSSHHLNDLFLAVVEGVEEAILDALWRAPSVVGRKGHVSSVLPKTIVLERLRAHGVPLTHS